MRTKLFSTFALISAALLLSACSPFIIAGSSGEAPAPVIEMEEPASVYQPVLIDHVQVDVGVGSPIPVEIIASGSWPDLCAQIASVESRMDGFQIDVTVHASSVDECPPDHVGLPFRFSLPLNIVEMSAGEYTIMVNGVSTTLDLPVQP